MKKRQQRQENKAVLYCRVSTIDQGENGNGLDVQTERLAAYCALQGLEVAATFTDVGISGGIPLSDRPEGGKMLEFIKREKIGHVIVLKLDRIFRNAEDALRMSRTWDKSGVGLHVIDMGNQSVSTASPIGKLLFTMMAAFAELERNMISERTTAALQHKKRNGERVGCIEYGYMLASDGKHLEPCPQEQKNIALILRLRDKGFSLRDIGSELVRRGIKNRFGRVAWHQNAIKSVVDNSARQTGKRSKKRP